MLPEPGWAACQHQLPQSLEPASFLSAPMNRTEGPKHSTLNTGQPGPLGVREAPFWRLQGQGPLSGAGSPQPWRTLSGRPIIGLMWWLRSGN